MRELDVKFIAQQENKIQRKERKEKQKLTELLCKNQSSSVQFEPCSACSSSNDEAKTKFLNLLRVNEQNTMILYRLIWQWHQTEQKQMVVMQCSSYQPQHLIIKKISMKFLAEALYNDKEVSCIKKNLQMTSNKHFHPIHL